MDMHCANFPEFPIVSLTALSQVMHAFGEHEAIWCFVNNWCLWWQRSGRHTHINTHWPSLPYLDVIICDSAVELFGWGCDTRLSMLIKSPREETINSEQIVPCSLKGLVCFNIPNISICCWSVKKSAVLC